MDSIHGTEHRPAVEAPRDPPGADAAPGSWVGASTGQLVQGLLFGILFGFLLQKGGVAKYHVLMGMFLLEDFTVAKVMLTAIATGMVGVYALQRLGLVELKIKETAYGAQVVGGLIFGVGFALLAYCSGTSAAALGQGNYDAIAGVLGLIGGSYLFALATNRAGGSAAAWGKRGKLTLPELLGVSRGAFIAAAAPALVALLALLGWLAER